MTDYTLPTINQPGWAPIIEAVFAAFNETKAETATVDAMTVVVTDYGAVGDAATDNAAALAAAAAAAAAAGARLHFPPGVYDTSAPLVVPADGMHITGVDATLRAITGSTANPLLLSISGRTGVTVEGLTFDGNAGNVTSFNNVVTVYMSSRVMFRRCRWQDTRGIGVIFSTSITDSGVIDCTFSEVGSHNKVSGLSGDRRQAAAFSSGTGNRGNYALGCTFSEVGLDCVSMTGQTEGRIIGCQIDNNYAGGFYVSSSTKVRVIGNRAFGTNGGNGIDVNVCQQIVVMGNVVSGRGSAGIMLNDTSNSVVSGNVCTDNWQNGTSVHQGGITLYGASTGCQNVTVTGNVCTDTQGTKTQQYGVQVSAAGHTAITIDDSNHLTGNALADVGGGGEFAPYSRTPTFTNITPNSGTVRARYVRTRTRVREVGSITRAADTSFAGSTARVNLPVNAHADVANETVIGTWAARDADTNAVAHGLMVKDGTTAVFRLANGTNGGVTSTTPFTFATGDVLSWELDYPPVAG